MAESKDHMLVLPKVVMVLRRLQLATAIAVLGLMAYGLTFLTFDGDQLMLFTVRPPPLLPLSPLLITNRT
jgi:hypothetical protein